MVFALFPDPPVVPQGVPGGGRVEAGLEQLAGEPLAEFAGIYARMMFLRVAMIGGTTEPSLFVQAGQGPAAGVTTASQPVFRATRPDGTGSGFVGDVFALPREGNVFRVLVGFDRATEEVWSLGIRNNDPGPERYFTWVVADSEAETVQPWVDPGSFVPAFDDPSFAPATGVAGTAVRLSGRNFNVGSPRVSFGTKEASLLPPTAAGTLTVAVPEGLVPPGEPVAEVPIRVQTAAGTAVAGTVFQVLAALPGFAIPPFDPVSGWPGRHITLFGRNLNVGRTQVFFGRQTARHLGHPTATALIAIVPEGLVNPGELFADLPVSVTTSVGTAVAGTAFRVILSEPPEFGDPPFNEVSGPPGRPVTLFGRNFDTGTPRVFFGRQEATVREPLFSHRLTTLVPEGLVAPGEPGADVPVAIHTGAGIATASVTFHAKPPMPQFADPFLTPKEARVGETITMHGSHFDFAPVRVFFRQSTGANATVEAVIVSRPSPTKIEVQVPFLPTPTSSFQVRVETVGGSVSSPLPLRITSRGI